MAEIRLQGVSKSFDEAARPALLPLDLTIPAGELVVLVGPSGCGKSTTLRLIAGLEEPDAGSVLIDGRDVTRVPPAQRDVAMVFQSYALYPHMSVRDNLGFALTLRKLGRAEIDRRVAAAAQALGIAELLERRPAQLSGGQRQRVAIGRAVVRDPKVFLFDEPLSNLDAQLRAEMRREIAKIHLRSQATAVYVTHDQTEAMTLADRIVVMRGGEVQQVGTPLELYDAPQNRFVAGFLGSPAMNFLRGRADEGALFVPGWRVNLAARARNGDVLAGVRPEDVRVGAEAAPDSLAARVEQREIMGAEAYLYLASEAGPLTARVEPHQAPAPGQTVGVTIEPEKIHLFDPATERRL